MRTWPRLPAGVGHRLGGRTKEETAVRSRKTKDGDGAPWRGVERRGHDSCAAGTVDEYAVGTRDVDVVEILYVGSTTRVIHLRASNP